MSFSFKRDDFATAMYSFFGVMFALIIFVKKKSENVRFKSSSEKDAFGQPSSCRNPNIW